MKKDSNSFRQFMVQHNACSEAVEWVGKKSLAAAWKKCDRTDWMMWLIFRLADDDMETAIRRACADIAESVWHLCVSDAQTALAWAIDAARRGNRNEMAAASSAAQAAGVHTNRIHAPSASAASAAYAAAYAAGYAAEIYVSSASAVYSAEYAAASAADDAGSATYAAAMEKQMKLNCDIIRKYIKVEDIQRLLEGKP